MVSSTSSRNGGARPTAAASSASNALLDPASAALFNAATSTNYVSLRGEPKDDRFLLSQFDLWDDTDAKGRSEEVSLQSLTETQSFTGTQSYLLTHFEAHARICTIGNY